MSAETLRRAAALMRERAGRAGNPAGFPSPWAPRPESANCYEVLCHPDESGLVADRLDVEVAEHIASWHPAVALAVADWLDAAVEWSAHDEPEFEAAVTVARAYLGASA